MVKVFIPELKGRIKRDIRGFWVNSSNKVDYDYIKGVDYPLSIEGLYYKGRFLDYLDNLKNYLKQEGIFFIKDDKGFIYSGRDSITELKGRKLWDIKGGQLIRNRGLLKDILKNYGGLTIYKNGRDYKIEVFTKGE